MSQTKASIFESDGIPAFSKALPLALQHVVAMIVGCVTPAILISDVAGLDERNKVILVQAALFVSAISTLLQLFPIFKGKNFQLGSRLPVIMGISFAYVPSMQAIAESYDVGTILGAQVIGGLVAIFVGFTIRKIRVFFPPIVTGTVVFTIGLSLYPTAVKYMAGGASSPDYGSWKKYFKACVYFSGYYRRLYSGSLLWTGKFLGRFFRRIFPASQTTSLWPEFRAFCLHCHWRAFRNQLHSGNWRLFCHNGGQYEPGT